VSWIKAAVSFIHAWRHPDEVAREVEAELRFHIEMRTRANIGGGMNPDEAQRAALRSFGDFRRFKTECCEIRRSLPFDSGPLRMGLHIALAAFAGAVALWAVNVPHHNFIGLFRQLFAITILTCLFVFVRRVHSKERFSGDHGSGVFISERESFFKNRVLPSDICEERSVNVASHDEQGRTPVERVFKWDDNMPTSPR
jgi:hypothetical protein